MVPDAVGGDPDACAAVVRARVQGGARVVLCTAAGRADEHAARLRLDGALAKPFSIEDLEKLMLAA
jgi:hypothetical protein